MTTQSFVVSDGTAGRWKITVYAYPVAESASNNTSTIRYRGYLEDGPYGSGPTGTIRNTWYVKLTDGNGTVLANKTGGAFTYSPDNGTVYLFNEADCVLTHNANGSGSVTVSCFAEGDIGPFSTVYGAGGSFGVEGITDFDFTAGVPTGFSATYTAGTGIVASWTASTSIKGTVTYYISYRSSSNGGVSYGAWSGESTTTSTSYTYSGLTPGLTYQFQVRAYNGYDNYSGYTQSNTVFLTAGGKRFSSPNWVLTAAQAKRWNGSAWVSLTTAKRYDATTKTWVNLS